MILSSQQLARLTAVEHDPELCVLAGSHFWEYGREDCVVCGTPYNQDEDMTPLTSDSLQPEPEPAKPTPTPTPAPWQVLTCRACGLVYTQLPEPPEPGALRGCPRCQLLPT